MRCVVVFVYRFMMMILEYGDGIRVSRGQSRLPSVLGRPIETIFEEGIQILFLERTSASFSMAAAADRSFGRWAVQYSTSRGIGDWGSFLQIVIVLRVRFFPTFAFDVGCTCPP